eukprot:m.181787 g.181787  ORF g.181787 m.181787 type:complete len:124 (-) comp32080_c0_seq21:199-570(-)
MYRDVSILPTMVCGAMSPRPTVVIVIVAKYRASTKEKPSLKTNNMIPSVSITTRIPNATNPRRKCVRLQVLYIVSLSSPSVEVVFLSIIRWACRSSNPSPTLPTRDATNMIAIHTKRQHRTLT